MNGLLQSVSQSPNQSGSQAVRQAVRQSVRQSVHEGCRRWTNETPEATTMTPNNQPRAQASHADSRPCYAGCPSLPPSWCDYGVYDAIADK